MEGGWGFQYIAKKRKDCTSGGGGGGGNLEVETVLTNLLAGEFEIDNAHQGAKRLENGLFRYNLDKMVCLYCANTSCWGIHKRCD